MKTAIEVGEQNERNIYAMNRHYMDARIEMNRAIEEFVRIARSMSFSEYSIAASISDSVFDIDKELYAYMQRELLPMVESFHGTKAVDIKQIEKDWDAILLAWDKRKMWEVLGT